MPVLLNNLRRQIAQRGGQQTETPLMWNEVFPALRERVINGVSGSDKVGVLALAGHQHLPIFSAEQAQALSKISVKRSFITESGRFDVDVPLGVLPNGSPRLYIRSKEGTVGAVAPSVDARFADAKAKWQGDHSGVPFPITSGQFYRASIPTPQYDVEIDSLAVRVPSLYSQQPPSSSDDFSFSRRTGEVSIYAQRGCKSVPDKRCVFCSIKTPATGRRASIDHIMNVVKQAFLEGKRQILFLDDNFAQNPKWVKALVGRIKEAGLVGKMRFKVVTRVDTLTDEVVSLLRDVRASIEIGLETLHPIRAERLGKVGKGQGEKYVADAIAAIRRLAKTELSGDMVSMIFVTPADSLADIAEDLLAQLTLYGKIGYGPRVNFNVRMPIYGDKETAAISGYPNLQKDSVPLDRVIGKTGILLEKMGNVESAFHPIAFEGDGDDLRVTGVFQPRNYVWPASLEKFVHYLGLRQEVFMKNFNLDGLIEKCKMIYQALEAAAESSTEMSIKDNLRLKKALAELRKEINRWD